MSDSTAKSSTHPSPKRNRFGAFGGVFTPAILTVLGVIMFMRANFVVGQAGILGALLILMIANSITFFTGLSISAISTNMQVRGGGAYFIISRVLGPEFGGAIGIVLFFALALSVPFYLLGFTEALVRSLPVLQPHFQAIAITAALLFFIVAYVGAGWAIRTQYVIMAILGLAIAAFLGGAALRFDTAVFLDNLRPGYTPIAAGAPETYTFWVLFAIYFPAVTGIDAGINMSGDLEDPSRSIPRGVLWAVAVGFVIYASEILLAGGAFPRQDLIAKPYQCFLENALGGLGFLVAAGVVAATLSSALGSYLAAPRVLQAVSRDPILPWMRPFAKGSVRGDEPRRALLLVGAIAVAVLLWAGNEAEGAALNAVAAVVSIFFLFGYGMLNAAAFIEAFGGNPSFRPRFRFFHWGTALIGAAGCAVTALLVNPLAAVVSVAILASLIWNIRRREVRKTFGDARRGFIYGNVRTQLLRLAAMPEDSRNWRPTVLVFAGNPERREELVTYSVWLEAGRGIVFLANVLVGELAELAPRRLGAVRQLSEFCRENDIQAFPVVSVAPDLQTGIRMLLQNTGIGPLKPNLAAFGWLEDRAHLEKYVSNLRTADVLGMSIALLDVRQLTAPGASGRIDIWWRGHSNGNLMLLLAHLLQSNWEFEQTRTRVLRVVENEAGRTPAREALEELIRNARIEADAEVIVSDAPFRELLHRHSADALCVFLGFELPPEGEEARWHELFRGHAAQLSPTVILVHSCGREDMTA